MYICDVHPLTTRITDYVIIAYSYIMTTYLCKIILPSQRIRKEKLRYPGRCFTGYKNYQTK